MPLFDCIFCVEKAMLVMENILKKSLVTNYLDEFREIAGNEQIAIQFSKKEEIKKYDPDRV